MQQLRQGKRQDACGEMFVFPNLVLNLSIIPKFGIFHEYFFDDYIRIDFYENNWY